MNKTTISTAILIAMCITGTAQAVSLTSLSITDWDGDTIAGGFAFASGVSATSKYTHFFDSTSSVTSTIATYTTDGGGIITNGVEQSPATTAAGDDSFTSGFLFTGFVFRPNSLAVTISGDVIPSAGGIQAGEVNSGVSSLDFSSAGTEFNWSGQFGTTLFQLNPDSDMTTNILTQGGACSAAIGSNQACYVLRWEHFIVPQGGKRG